MVGEKVTERLAYKERIANVKSALGTFKNDSLVQTLFNLGTGFGRNNRRLIGLAR